MKNFHAIIRPGDSVGIDSEDELDHGVSLVRCNPILLMEPEDWNQGTLKKRLGIPKEALLCYVQLGAGKINDINSEISLVLNALSQHPKVYVIVGESMLGREFPQSSRESEF